MGVLKSGAVGPLPFMRKAPPEQTKLGWGTLLIRPDNV